MCTLLMSNEIVNEGPSLGLFLPHVSHFLYYLLIILLFKMVPRTSAEVLSSVPKCKKAVMCLTEKRHVIHKLHSGMSCSAVGSDFNVNELMMYILNQKLNRNT